VCVDLNRVAEALADAGRARVIFTTHSEFEKRLRLDHDTAYVYTLLGDHQRALQLYRSALATALALGATGEKYLGTLYSNLGFIYDALGDLQEALAYQEQARDFFQATNATRHAVMAETQIAIIAMTQGHYHRALQLLLHARDLYAAAELDRDKVEVDRLRDTYGSTARVRLGYRLRDQLEVFYGSREETYGAERFALREGSRARHRAERGLVPEDAAVGSGPDSRTDRLRADRYRHHGVRDRGGRAARRSARRAGRVRRVRGVRRMIRGQLRTLGLPHHDGTGRAEPGN
jgi:tetratricopeptide (TPR) repeat protein